MKKVLLYSFCGFMSIAAVLLMSGLVNVGVSPYFHYKLNAAETAVFDAALLKFRERVENGSFEDVENELADGPRSKSEIIAEMKRVREQFGKPVATEFFRSGPPDAAAKFYRNLDGNVYIVHYFTKTEKDEFFEAVTWNINERNEAKIINYDGSKMVDWQIKTRERERIIAAHYSNEFKIPFGSRFIEIRY